MKYKTRSLIICRKMMDEYYLISSGDASKVCPAMQQINAGAAYYWDLLTQDKTTEEMLDIASSESGIDKETLRPGLEQFIRGLEERQYIYCTDE